MTNARSPATSCWPRAREGEHESCGHSRRAHWSRDGLANSGHYCSFHFFIRNMSRKLMCSRESGHKRNGMFGFLSGLPSAGRSEDTTCQFSPPSFALECVCQHPQFDQLVCCPHLARAHRIKFTPNRPAARPFFSPEMPTIGLLRRGGLSKSAVEPTQAKGLNRATNAQSLAINRRHL